ncbi:hypothetical protein PR048_020972 [Dryococelus australis]|uniref:Uncharacterized protein n=1 Tax=Dryococelus australis TaxID=614101 RepID=A0ABQ9GWX1_9NEOP|nr:hypothetical protein PR048_020972 [Dryococelus australis]
MEVQSECSLAWRVWLHGYFRRNFRSSLDATPAEVTLYNSNIERFVKAESNAWLFLTTNMTEDTLEKVME